MDLERPIKEIGTDLAARMPRPRARLDRSGRAAHDRAADEGPGAARGAVPLRRRAPGVRYAGGRDPPPARVPGRRASPRPRAARRASPAARSRSSPIAAIAGAGVKQMAQQFIVGADAQGRAARDHEAVAAAASRRPSTCSARPPSPRPRPTATCSAARRRCARSPPPRPSPARSTSPSRSPRSRRCCAPTAPERGIEGARPRLAHLLRVASEVGAHLHVDMESFDTREAITALTLDLLSAARVRRRPVRRHRPAGLPRRLARAPRATARLGARARRASTRSRSAWSRAPTGTTRSSRPRSTAGRRRCSPTAATATATSRSSPSA